MSPAAARALITTAVRDADLAPGDVSIFPTEGRPTGGFSQAELFAQSRVYSGIYRRLIDALEGPVAEHTGLPVDAARIAVRNGVIIPTHFFLDRALRLDRLLARHENAPLAVLNGKGPTYIDRYESFRDATGTSADLNAALVGTLGAAFGLATEARGRPSTPRAPPPPFRNNNYGQRIQTQAQRAFWRALGRAVRAVAPAHEGRCPALAMGLMTGALEAAGLFAPGRLALVTGRATFPTATRDLALRKQILAPALEAARPELAAALRELGMAPARVDAATDAFLSYVSEAFPPDLLEGLGRHVSTAREVLEPFPGRAIFFMHAATVESIAILAAARMQGRRLVAIQHGGHEGYEDDLVQPMETDYPHADVLISWGWQGLPTYDASRVDVPVIPMVTPFLAERGRWPSKTGAHATHDVLFLPNKLYPWPAAAPTGASVSRIDHVGAFSQMLEDVARGAAASGISILCKPYNPDTLTMLPQAQRTIAEIGPGRFDIWPGNEKGLSAELLARARLVLWDQPGTGFLECLARGIPTVVYWPRIYNREVVAARPLFDNLAQQGVVVADLPAAIASIQEMLERGPAWMKEPARQDACAQFMHRYGRTGDDWAAAWRALIRELDADPAASSTTSQPPTRPRATTSAEHLWGVAEHP